jgi:hypothetical protein
MIEIILANPREKGFSSRKREVAYKRSTVEFSNGIILSYFLDTTPKDVIGEEPNWVSKPF